jgi:hypothetical protein
MSALNHSALPMPLVVPISNRATLQPPEKASRNLGLAQSKWDRFYEDAFFTFDDLNQDLRRDKALDKTIRALGQRPSAPLTQAQREDLAVSMEVACVLYENSRQRNMGGESEMLLTRRCREEDYFESLCDEACEG